MVSRKNINYKRQQEAKRIPHYGLRKLSVGVASVLLGTVFYMQNGTVHADVNPTVSADDNSAKVVNENSGTSSSTIFASSSNRVSSTNSASSVDSTGNATNLITARPVSTSSVERAASHVASTVNEPGSGTPTSQANAGANAVPVQNRSTGVSTGNTVDEHLAANLKVNPSVLAVSKVASTGASNNAVNGGFDQSTWGTLDVSKWTGRENNGVYELTGYTGDLEHIIVPNSADFAKAGRNVGQVGISADTTHSWFEKGSPKSIAFSKTDGQMVKAVGSDWTVAFTGAFDRNGEHIPIESALTLFDGSNLDVSNVTDMFDMFAFNQISDLTSLANWKTDNVTDMRGVFGNNQISDLTPLANWKTDNVTDMGVMFMGNQISNLAPLANWKTSNVTNMSGMFDSNQIAYADFTKWNFGKVQDLNNFISQWGTPAIIIVKSADQTLLSDNWVIATKQNQLHFGADTVDMPTVYVASDKADARQKILADIKSKLADYQKSHADVDIKLVKPLDQLTELVDLANAKFTVVSRTLPELDTNDLFALNPANGLHEHKNVNDNGGYDKDFWGTLDVSKFTTVKNGDNLEITGYTGDASKVIIPNIADFWTNHLDQGAKQVTISRDVMFSLAQNATRIGLSKTNNQKVVAGDANWSHAFSSGYTKLNLMDLHNLDTTNITNMSSMFSDVRNLKVVGDLSQWNTANVTDMGGMFSSASGLTNIGDLSQWNTANVTDMSAMFSGASELTNIGDLNNWNTFKVTDMGYMFCYASKLTNIGDLDNWNTSKVTDMSRMFQEASSLTNIGNLSKWDVSNVTNMDAMFQQASSLTNIGDLDNWNTFKVTDMGWMFDQASALTNIGDLNKWNTSKVNEMGFMFSNASALTNIGDLSKWNVSDVFDMNGMFYQASALTNIGDLSKWDVSNVTSMSGMFYQASALTSIGNLSNWDTSKVTAMRYMFSNVPALKELNISNWDLTKLEDKDAFQYFANGDPNLVVIANNVKLPTWYQNELGNSNYFWNDHMAVITNNETLLKATGSIDNVMVDDASDKRPIFYDSKGSDDAVAVLKQANQVYSKQYQSEHPVGILTLASDVDQTDPIALANAKFVVKRTLSELDTNDAFALDPVNGLHEHKNVNDNGGYDTDFWGTLDVSKFTTVKNGDNLEITGYTGDAAKVIIPNIADFWAHKLDQGAKQVTISSSLMHKLAKNATQIGLSKTNNQKVVAGDAIWQDAFGGMTYEPNTSSNANGGMWVYNPNLATMDLHNLDTTNITDMGSMFNGGRNLNVVGDLSQWNVANVVDMDNMFQSASSLTNIGNLDNWDTNKVTDMISMFSCTTNLTNIGDLSKWDTGNVTNMGGMFANATNLTNIGNLDNWDTNKVTDMSWMFGTDTGKQSHLINIGDLSKWQTGNVTDMHNMFYNATNLTNIGDLSKWNTSKVTDMSWMFGTDSGKQSHLTNIGDLSKWQTGNVTDMSLMFANATGLTNIGNLDDWNTSNVTNMSWMFGGTINLTNIGNLDDWNTSKVTDMNHMFYNATNLTNIGDLSKWNTSKVTDMSWMFGTDSGKQSHLTNIGDLSKWQTGNVTDMSLMFANATGLTNIGNLDDWNTSNVTNMSWMFGGTTNLTNIGDLSKWQTGNVTNMNSMFYDATHLTSIGDLSKWNTSKVTNMSWMFASTDALRHLNISNWNLTKLANKDAMKNMFANETNLTIIANDLTLPVWYQNEISDADYFWNHHIAVITNVPELIRSTGDIDSLKIDKQDASRSIFYDSKGSADAISVLKQANQVYIKRYQNEHPGYTLNLAADVDQTDPIALANAKFVSAPLDVQFKIGYYDLTGKLVDSTISTHKVGDTVLISPVAPANYVLAKGQSKANYLMHWGLNEADFLVMPKVTMTPETKTVSRIIKVQTPDGQTNNVVQTVRFVRNGYLNQVTKQTLYSPWSFNGQYQFSSYQPKPIDGYTADVASAVIVTPNSSDTMLSLAYHKLAADYSVVYQLANGTVVNKVSVTPGSDERIQLTAPKGYRLLTSANTLQADFGSQTFVALIAPDEQTYTAHDVLPTNVTEPLSKTVTRTVKITMPNGRVRTIKQQVKFERTATINSDGTVIYSNWQAIGRAQFNRVFVPKRHGYRLVITDANGKALADVEKINNVTAEMNDEVVSVKYVKD